MLKNIKTIELLIPAIIIISALGYSTQTSIEIFSLSFFYIFSCAAVILAINNNKGIHGPEWLPEISGNFLVACALSTVFSNFMSIPLASLLMIFLGALIISVISHLKFEYVTIAVQIVILANTLILLGQELGFSPIISNPNGEPGGMFGNAPRMCMYLAITLPLIFRSNLTVALNISLLGLVYRELYLPIFFIMLVLQRFWNKYYLRYFIIGVLISIIGINIDKIVHSLQARSIVWLPTIDQIFLRPLSGFGGGMFPHLSDDFVKSNYYHADNAFSSVLQFIFSYGLVCFGFLCYVFKKIVVSFPSSPYKTSLIFLAIISLTEYPFEVPRLWPVICVLIAGTLSYKHNETESA